MNDLLEQLRDLNPVPGCDRPSVDDVWRKLEAQGGQEARSGRDDWRNSRASKRLWGAAVGGARALPALAVIAVTLTVAFVALSGIRARPHTSLSQLIGHSKTWNASDGQGPSLSEMMVHFGVLRRGPTAAERADIRMFGGGTGTGLRTEYPTFVRLLGNADGTPVDMVISADFKHGASGPVVSYSTDINGSSYVESNYLIFPDLTGSPITSKRVAYYSVVPDGIRTVRWQFECLADASGCVLPGGRHVVYVPVRHNLAVLPLSRINPGESYAGEASITWYHDDGTRTRFTNSDTAVPFAGAPAYPESAGAQPGRFAAGDGPPAGKPLFYWRSLYSFFRRPQTTLDRSPLPNGTRGNGPIVPQLTRVVLNAEQVRVFVTLSAVNPSAAVGNRRYVSQVVAVNLTGRLTNPLVEGTLSPEPQAPSSSFRGNGGFLDYNIVPDSVTTVRWRFDCASHCRGRSTVKLMLRVHNNVVYALPPSNRSGSLSIGGSIWYERGRTKPLDSG